MSLDFVLNIIKLVFWLVGVVCVMGTASLFVILIRRAQNGFGEINVCVFCSFLIISCYVGLRSATKVTNYIGDIIKEVKYTGKTDK